jgi:hypothetical protein
MGIHKVKELESIIGNKDLEKCLCTLHKQLEEDLNKNRKQLKIEYNIGEWTIIYYDNR